MATRMTTMPSATIATLFPASIGYRVARAARKIERRTADRGGTEAMVEPGSVGGWTMRFRSHHCLPACRVIDRADGVEDGKLYKTEHYPVGSERHVVAAIKRSEDRVADRITAFAGSLNFVYI